MHASTVACGKLTQCGTGRLTLLVHPWCCRPQVTGVMKEMVPSLPVPHAMGYGTPFPTPNHELAVVRAPRLAFMTFFSGRQVAALRSWGIVKFLEAAVPGEQQNPMTRRLHGCLPACLPFCL